MGVDFELAIKAEYIAHHIKHSRGLPDHHSSLFLSEAYNMLMGDHKHAEEILALYELAVARDLKNRCGSLMNFKYVPLETK